MSTVSRNKIVSVSYVLRKADGEIYELSDLPIAYLHGAGSDLFPQIERALEGKSIGEQVVVTLDPDQAFGAHDPGLVLVEPLDQVPEPFRHVGAEFEARNESGETRRFVVTGIGDGRLMADANHPLAGQRVIFEVTVRGIREASPEELESGRPAGQYETGAL
jgi:FKBP-type peptidyl-prolyl cis-trans isomerase SlyD